MTDGILITRSSHDLPNMYLSYWCEPLIERVKKSDIPVLDLVHKKASPNNLLSYITKRKPAVIFLNGHGGPDFICGYEDVVLIDRKNCENLLKGKMVYARSCQAGAILGPYCVKKGAKAFIGYSRNYSVGYSEEKRTRPLSDNIARLFLEPSNLIPQSLIFGNSPSEAYKISQKEMRKNLQYMLSSKATMDERDAAPYLWNNIKYQVVIEQ